VIEALAQALQDKAAGVRVQAAQAIGELGGNSKTAVPALSRVARTDVKRCRIAAIQAIGDLGPDGADGALALADCLTDKDEDIRRKSALALSALKEHARLALPQLVSLAKSSSENTLVRCCAIGAMAGIGGDNVVQLLKELAKSDDDSIRAAAKKALAYVERKQKEASK
jgi:HEAT repeat protein